jgi:alpha-glucosidase
MEVLRNDGIKLKAEALQDGILHVQAGSLDGYIQGLLNRYKIIETLPPCAEAREEGNILHLPEGYTITVEEDLGFSLEKNGDVLFQTKEGYKPGTAQTYYQNQGYQLATSLQPEEKLIGFGDQCRKGFLLNGQKESLWIRNQSSYIPVPFFMSSRGYGILINTTRRLFFDFGVTNPSVCTFKTDKDYLDIYIFTGESYTEILRKYTLLTGRPQLPPMYTFGLWLIAQEHIRAHELLQLAHHMRQAEIPCDILALEPGWMETRYDETVDKKWNKERFPYYPWAGKRPSTFVGDLKLMGFHFGLWMGSTYDHTWEEERLIRGDVLDVRNADEPIINRTDLELAEQDEHFGHNPTLMDKVTKPEEPFFEHLKEFVDQSVDFFKQDGFAQINPHPDRLYGNGRHDDEMHNINFLLYTRQMICGLEEHTGRRAFTLAVAGWVGFQRFPGVWAGDTGGGAQSMCGLLQDAIVGQPFTTCDMDVDSLEGIHMGFLLPWAQINSWAYYRYPVYKGAALQNIFQEYANLRMKLLPFLYSLAHEATISAKPIMQPMLLVYPQKEEAYHLTRQFQLGNALLVGVHGKEITLPDGKWFDFWNNEIIEGDWNVKSLPYPEDRGGHLFIREGAIVPLAPIQQHVGEKPLDTLTWLIFPGTKNSYFDLYLDDGVSFEYQKEEYASTRITCQPGENKLEITWETITGKQPERIAEITHTFEIIHPSPKHIKRILIDGEDSSFQTDDKRKRVIIGSIRHGQSVILEMI